MTNRWAISRGWSVQATITQGTVSVASSPLKVPLGVSPSLNIGTDSNNLPYAVMTGAIRANATSFLRYLSSSYRMCFTAGGYPFAADPGELVHVHSPTDKSHHDKIIWTEKTLSEVKKEFLPGGNQTRFDVFVSIYSSSIMCLTNMMIA